MKRIVLIAAPILASGLVAGLWLVRQRSSQPVSVVVENTAASPKVEKQAHEQSAPDYAKIFFAAGDDGLWMLSRDLEEDELWTDAAYCDQYLSWLISHGSIEWGKVLAQRGLAAADRARFVGLLSRKKVALVQARVAARALGPEAGRNGRAELLASVTAEYEARIREAAGAELFAAYQASTEGEAWAVLEPLFSEASARGLALTPKQEQDLVELVVALRSTKTRKPATAAEAFLAFDAAGDERLSLSLDQILLVREYQEKLRTLKKPGKNSELTSARAIAGNFSNQARQSLALNGAATDSLRTSLGDLLAGRIDSAKFASDVTAVMGAEKFTALVDFAKKTALNRELSALDRKVRIAQVSVSDAERDHWRAMMESAMAGRGEGETATGRLANGASSEAVDALVESHVKGRVAAQRMLAAIEAHEAAGH